MMKGSGTKAERKTARINVLLRQSVKEDASKIAYMKRETLNAVIDRLLEEYIAGHQAELKKYHEVFEKGES